METVDEFIIRTVRRFGSKQKPLSFSGETEYDFLKRIFDYYSRKTQEEHIKMRRFFKEFEAPSNLQRKTETFLDIFFIHKTENLNLSSAELLFIESTRVSILPHLKLFCANLLKIKKINHIFLKRFSAIAFLTHDLQQSKAELDIYFVNDFFQSDEYKKIYAMVGEWKHDHIKRGIYFMRPNNVPLLHGFWD